MGRREGRAVRLFEHAVRLLPECTTNMLGTTSGKLVQNLRNYGHRLRKLAEKDPDGRFWPTLQKANLKMIKFLLDAMR
jgi:hypothetical protein